MRLRPNQTAPGPSGGDMIRGFGLIRTDTIEFLMRAWEAHGDVVQFPIPSPATYLITDPEAAREILTGRLGPTSKDTIQYRSLGQLTGDGLLTADDPPWRERRRALQPTFGQGMAAAAAAAAEQAALVTVENWRSRDPGSPVDMAHEMAMLSLHASTSTLFGVTSLPNDAALNRAVLEALDCIVARARNPLRSRRKPNRKLRNAKAQVDEFAVQVSGLPEPEGRTTPTVQGAMAAAPTEVGGAEAKRDEVVTALVAGHETVASTLTWAWYLLAQKPDAFRKVRAESGRAVDQMPFTRAVVDETLRLYPPAWIITRRTQTHMTIGEYELPNDSLVLLSPWLIHRHPSVWRAPAEFDPYRFVAQDERRVGYLPFGTGSRMCIGREMALAEATTALSTIAGKCKPVLQTQSAIRVLPSVTARPAHDLSMRIEFDVID